MGVDKSQNFIRDAVLASLKNDAKVSPLTGEANEEAVKPTETKEDDDNKSDVVSEKQEGEKPAPKKRKRAANIDSNWKALQKKIQKPNRLGLNKANLKSKFTRKPSTIMRNPNNVATSPSPTENEDDADAKSKDNAIYSSFMSRAARLNADLTSIVAMDCEMVGVGPDGKKNALARVSVVNYAGDVLYDTFVKPGELVTDYRTQYSGVRESDIGPESNAVDAFEAQCVVGEIFKGRIVVGHALKNDFRVLRIAHPGQKVRDTSDYYRKLWNRKSTHRPALRMLVAQVLGVDTFQKDEHDSCEDARAALALYKHNSKDWERRLREGGGVLKKRFGDKSSSADQPKRVTQ